MTDYPLIISFYTKNSLYEKWAEELKDSCKKFNLDYDIEGIDLSGSWFSNCCYKPTFILKKLQEHKRPILWIDSDAILLKKPTIFSFLKSDLALQSGFKKNFSEKWFFSGVIYSDFNEKTLDFFKRWSSLCESEIKNGSPLSDESYLCMLLHTKHDLIIYDLPVEYNAQPSTFENCYFSCNVEDIVILDRQGSRFARRGLDKLFNDFSLTNFHNNQIITLLSENKLLYEGKEEFRNCYSKRFEIIKDFIQENATILEIGAFHGFNTIKLHETWPKAKIIAFEPNLDSITQLKLLTSQIKNISISNELPLKNIRIIYTNHKELKIRKFLEDQGFSLLAHWYSKQKGTAIFIEKK